MAPPNIAVPRWPVTSTAPVACGECGATVIAADTPFAMTDLQRSVAAHRRECTGGS